MAWLRNTGWNGFLLSGLFCNWLVEKAKWCLRAPVFYFVPKPKFGQNWLYINSLRPRPNRRHFADDIFKCIFDNENEWISPRRTLMFVPKVRISNIPALVQIMAWRRPGDKPLSEPMMVSLLTHICVTRPQWVNSHRRSQDNKSDSCSCDSLA